MVSKKVIAILTLMWIGIITSHFSSNKNQDSEWVDNANNNLNILMSDVRAMNADDKNTTLVDTFITDTQRAMDENSKYNVSEKYKYAQSEYGKTLLSYQEAGQCRFEIVKSIASGNYAQISDYTNLEDYAKRGIEHSNNMTIALNEITGNNTSNEGILVTNNTSQSVFDTQKVTENRDLTTNDTMSVSSKNDQVEDVQLNTINETDQWRDNTNQHYQTIQSDWNMILRDATDYSIGTPSEYAKLAVDAKAAKDDNDRFNISTSYANSQRKWGIFLNDCEYIGNIAKQTGITTHQMRDYLYDAQCHEKDYLDAFNNTGVWEK